MTITDFLNSLKIIHDASDDYTWLAIGAGVLCICLTLLLLFVIIDILGSFRADSADNAIGIKIGAVLGMTTIIVFAIWGAIHSFTTPAYKLEWIVSTENIDVSSLYQYFEIESAPIANTVQIIPKGEFYDTISEWYVTHKPLVAPL